VPQLAAERTSRSSSAVQSLSRLSLFSPLPAKIFVSSHCRAALLPRSRTIIIRSSNCSLRLSATRQKYFSLRTNQSPTTSILLSEQTSTSQPNRLAVCSSAPEIQRAGATETVSLTDKVQRGGERSEMKQRRQVKQSRTG
jgi:hypothetical protein